MEEKSFVNKDLHNVSEEKFSEQLKVDFIDDNFIDHLEWAMLLIQGQFKQMHYSNSSKRMTANHFDKAYLMSHAGLNANLRFAQPYSSMQASPEVFPNINVKFLTISDSFQLGKIKELDFKSKRHLKIKRQYAFELSTAFYKTDTESFYCLREGYEINRKFFSTGENLKEDKKLTLDNIPLPITLDAYTHLHYYTAEQLAEVMSKISMAYQMVMSMYYEWCIYIKEYDNIGLVLPIDPSLLPEIYKTSLLKFDSKKRMLHFVKSHYRRRIALPNEDYSVFIKRYLRGEHRFDYKGFYAEIIPPRYDLNRVKTRKKFINALN